MLYQFRPLGPWTEPETKPRASSARFRASWNDTLKLLGRELDHLQARNVVIQIDVREGDLRLDGLPKADAKVGHPGVRIAFESKHGPLTYATDSYDALYSGDLPGWKANVRAIALGLEALRAVDRYGVTRRGEQYRGWQQLPAGTGSAPTGMTKTEAVALIAAHTGVGFIDSHSINDSAEMRRRLRQARANAHPDRHGGDSTAFHQLEQAGRLLGLIT